jgi:hypothetical protein
MTLRELLETKQRRRMVVPIQISDPSEDQEIWLGAHLAMEGAKNRQDESAIAELRPKLDEAQAKIEAHWAALELHSLPSDQWETACQVWRTELDQADAEAGIDWPNALAPLLAESCVDPELHDVDWWREQLARPGWSEGDRDALKLALLRLNVATLEPHVPKD